MWAPQTCLRAVLLTSQPRPPPLPGAEPAGPVRRESRACLLSDSQHTPSCPGGQAASPNVGRVGASDPTQVGNPRLPRGGAASPGPASFRKPETQPLPGGARPGLLVPSRDARQWRNALAGPRLHHVRRDAPEPLSAHALGVPQPGRLSSQSKQGNASHWRSR